MGMHTLGSMDNPKWYAIDITSSAAFLLTIVLLSLASSLVSDSTILLSM